MSDTVLASGLACLLAGAAGAQEGGIEIFAGETLFETGLRTSITELYKPRRDLFRGSSEVADPLDRTFRESRTVLGLDYGLERDVTLSLLVPFVYRELRSTAGTLEASGLGDIALLAKYRFLRHEGRAKSFNWSVIGGVETATGATDETEGGVRLPPSLQPGKGAWNPFVATSVTYSVDRARFDATVFYKLNTEGAQSHEDGDFFSVDASAAYRFLHFKYPGPTFGARLGLQWRHEGRAEQFGAPVGDSGADELLLRPALSIHPTPDTDLNLSARIPLYQDYHGEQLGRGVELGFAFGIRF